MSDFIDTMRENAERDASLEEMTRKYATGRIMEAAKRGRYGKRYEVGLAV